MEYRIGQCSQCGAEYKIPSSFKHNVARCKVCAGVVHLDGGKPVGAEPQPVDTAHAADKRRERGTLARLKAQRSQGQEQSAAPKPAAAPAKKVASKAKEAALEPAQARADEPAGRRRGRKEPAGAVSTRRRPGRSSGKRGEGTSTSRDRRGGRTREKKGLPVGGMIGIGGLLIIGGGAALYMSGIFGGGDEPETVAAAEPAEAPEEAPTPEELAPEETPEETPAEPEDNPFEEPKTVSPDDVDLTVFEDFGPARGTSDEEWAEIQELAATFMDLDAGAAGPRAGRRLKELGRLAMPALINEFKTIDFSTDEGHRKGDMMQIALKDICNGSNFEWRYPTDENYVWFNKKVVENWAKYWGKCVESIEDWIILAKLESKDPEEAARLRGLFGQKEDDGFVSDDDLDVD